MKNLLIGTLILASGAAVAEAPELKTPAPVIYLADNLDEEDQLGWCIDTLGRGFAETLQAHSCKPQGGDVQFTFEPENGLIRSAAFPEYCAEHTPNADLDFALSLCDPTMVGQQFTYISETKAISPAGDATMCLVVGSQSRQAGPFMSRPLEMAACSQTPAQLREWVVLDD